jgi:hypothetical protein
MTNMAKREVILREIHGRHVLWATDIMECQECLKIAARSEANYERTFQLNLSSDIQPESDNLEPDPDAPAIGEPDQEPAQHPCPFPTNEEFRSVARYLRMLAIVAFNRMWASGHEHKGYALKNTAGEIQQLRLEVVRLAFPDPDDYTRFEVFREKLKSIRDEVVAHTHAERAEIYWREDGTFLSCNAPSNVVSQVDMDYFFDCVERILRALWKLP